MSTLPTPEVPVCFYSNWSWTHLNICIYQVRKCQKTRESVANSCYWRLRVIGLYYQQAPEQYTRFQSLQPFFLPGLWWKRINSAKGAALTSRFWALIRFKPLISCIFLFWWLPESYARILEDFKTASLPAGIQHFICSLKSRPMSCVGKMTTWNLSHKCNQVSSLWLSFLWVFLSSKHTFRGFASFTDSSPRRGAGEARRL